MGSGFLWVLFGLVEGNYCVSDFAFHATGLDAAQRLEQKKTCESIEISVSVVQQVWKSPDHSLLTESRFMLHAVQVSWIN